MSRSRETRIAGRPSRRVNELAKRRAVLSVLVNDLTQHPSAAPALDGTRVGLEALELRPTRSAVSARLHEMDAGLHLVP